MAKRAAARRELPPGIVLWVPMLTVGIAPQDLRDARRQAAGETEQ